MDALMEESFLPMTCLLNAPSTLSVIQHAFDKQEQKELVYRIEKDILREVLEKKYKALPSSTIHAYARTIKDEEEQNRLFYLGAIRGDALCQYERASLVAYGDGHLIKGKVDDQGQVIEDEQTQEWVHWAKRSADQECVEGRMILAQYYFYMHKEKEALALLEQNAALMHGPSEYYLGEYYRWQGDPVKEMAWYRRAYEHVTPDTEASYRVICSMTYFKKQQYKDDEDYMKWEILAASVPSANPFWKLACFFFFLTFLVLYH